MRFSEITIGRRQLMLNPNAIAYMEPMSPAAGVIVVLVTGERIEDVEATPRDLAKQIADARSWRLPVEVVSTR